MKKKKKVIINQSGYCFMLVATCSGTNLKMYDKK